MLGVSASLSGLALIAFMAGTVFGSQVTTRVMVRIAHYMRVPMVGLAIAVIVLVMLGTNPAGYSIAEFVGLLFALGCGLGPMYPMSTIVMQNAVKPHQLGTATGTLNFFRTLGGAIIVAVFGALVLGGSTFVRGHDAGKARGGTRRLGAGLSLGVSGSRASSFRFPSSAFSPLKNGRCMGRLAWPTAPNRRPAGINVRQSHKHPRKIKGRVLCRAECFPPPRWQSLRRRFTAGAARGATIIDDWYAAKLPSPPQLKPVTLVPKETALLVMDFTVQTCTVERRKRCANSVPMVKAFVEPARAKGALIIYRVAVPKSVPGDILKELTPARSRKFSAAWDRKFINSDLEKTLRDKGITTVVAMGTQAQTSVLHTGADAVLRGFKVIVPVDAMSAGDLFPELYTAWHLANAARISNQVTLTQLDMISF